MATTTGTASNYLDLLARLRDFLTSNGWVQIGGQAGAITGDADFVSLRGTGLTGSDNILVTVQPFSASGNNAYSLRTRGHTAYVDPGTSQPGADSPWTYLLTLNSPVTYWFVANGRRFIVVTRSSSRYDAMYAGFILPEHLPNDWSYPLYVGGSSYTGSSPQSEDTPHHSNFWHPVSGWFQPTSQVSAFLFTPAQAWMPVRNGYNSGNNNVQDVETGRAVLPWSRICRQNYRRQLDGDPWFTRGQLAALVRSSAGTADPNVPEGGCFYGSFDGVFYTPAFGATAEQEAVVAGVTYKMFPNVSRTADGQFAAIAME